MIAELLGTARGGTLAIVGEKSLQEECVHASCLVYVVDTTVPTFQRILVVELPPRYDVLEKKHWSDKTPKECSRVVGTHLVEEDREAHDPQTAGQPLLLTRYLE